MNVETKLERKCPTCERIIKKNYQKGLKVKIILCVAKQVV